MSESVNHPAHYNSHPSGVECIELVQWLPFNLGNAVKYLWRKDDKGKPQEDIEKAIWYIKQEQVRAIEAGGFWGWYVPSDANKRFLEWRSAEPLGFIRDVISGIWEVEVPDQLEGILSMFPESA